MCQELLDEVRNDQNLLSRVKLGKKPGFIVNGAESKVLFSQWEPVLLTSEGSQASQVEHQERVYLSGL